jgi:hypothetical protein
VIRRGDRIVTLLFVTTTRTPEADYSKRNPAPHDGIPTSDTMSRLGKDFLDFKNRAEVIAKRVVDDARVESSAAESKLRTDMARWESRGKGWLAIVGLIATVFPLLVQSCGNIDLKQRIATLEGRSDVAGLGWRIAGLQRQVDSLRHVVCTVQKRC